MRQLRIPGGLPGIELPLTIVLGLRFQFPEFSTWKAALIAVILAPTDADLGQAVVSCPIANH